MTGAARIVGSLLALLLIVLLFAGSAVAVGFWAAVVVRAFNFFI